MRKIKFGVIFLFFSFVVVFLLSGCGKESSNFAVLDKDFDAYCQSICSNASTICPSLIDQSVCESKCPDFNDETKDHLLDSKSCEELAQRADLIADLLIPEINTPEEKLLINDCDAACGSYVNKCLTLVPNATQALFDDGYNSCLQECDKWDANKVDCMINAFDCESMTDVCGL